MTKKKELIALQKEWYQKLSKDGFQDIEYFDKDMNPKYVMYKDIVKVWLTLRDKFPSTEQYYIEAGQFYHDYSFDSDTDKRIWLLHSEGHAYRTILKKLNIPYQTILKTVNKYKNLMLDPVYRNQNGT